jgi:outer membrane protein, protease secretion system
MSKSCRLSTFAMCSLIAQSICLIMAQPVFALDLMQSYELVLRNDPTYRSASKDYEAGLENNTIGRSALFA